MANQVLTPAMVAREFLYRFENACTARGLVCHAGEPSPATPDFTVCGVTFELDQRRLHMDDAGVAMAPYVDALVQRLIETFGSDGPLEIGALPLPLPIQVDMAARLSDPRGGTSVTLYSVYNVLTDRNVWCARVAARPYAGTVITAQILSAPPASRAEQIQFAAASTRSISLTELRP